jgi:hypothetical protein
MLAMKMLMMWVEWFKFESIGIINAGYATEAKDAVINTKKLSTLSVKATYHRYVSISK